MEESVVVAAEVLKDVGSKRYLNDGTGSREAEVSLKSSRPRLGQVNGGDKGLKEQVL